MDAKLVLASGRARGREIPLPITILTIGRARRCHVRPHCPLVSKLHCAVARWAGKVTVRDLKSANGTFVNGRRIDGEARVHDGDTITVGSVSFTVRISPSLAGTLPDKVLNEGDVRWLLKDPGEASALDLSETHRLELEALRRDKSIGEDEPPEESEGEPGMSAGDYLRDYLRVWYGSTARDPADSDHQNV